MNAAEGKSKLRNLWTSVPETSSPLRKSTTDFRGFLSHCELNYHKLLRVYPLIQSSERRNLWLYCVSNEQIQLQMRVTERTPYTDVLELKLMDPGAFITDAKMTIRVYHDMKVIEILNVQTVDVRRSSIQVAPKVSMQPDERVQAVRLLGEWLTHALNFGASTDESLESLLTQSKSKVKATRLDC